jgi:hypothetical protein
LFDWVYSPPKDTLTDYNLSYDYYKNYQEKKIGTIKIIPLEVFGPNFEDTTRIPDNYLQRIGNKLHTKTNLKVLSRNLWIKEGGKIDPDLMMDQERLLRTLPYLQDVRIVIKPRSGDEQVVDLLILTKDVFSFGISGSVTTINKADIKFYDRNVFGNGHEVAVRFLGNTNTDQKLGVETSYTINNFNGNFINLSAGYANQLLLEGAYFSISREFLRPQTVYAGELLFLRTFRSLKIDQDDNIINTYPLNFMLLDGWYGRRIRPTKLEWNSRFQVNLSGRIRYMSFNNRPLPDSNNRQFFANSTFYAAGLSFSQRSYVRDKLIYSYGITEDIPKGFLHELVLGFDDNEFGNRWYSHVFLSTGNLFSKKPFYLYSSLAFGTFWKPTGMEQGILDLRLNYISPLFNLWNIKSRQFIKLHYTLGINRFEIENLLIRNGAGIRGFGSRTEYGKQRLTLNFENVFFQNLSIVNFRTAIYSFVDMGIVVSEKESIFKQSFYSGIGVGLRIHNENLVFNTIQIRLAYYPNHPDDVNAFGFIIDGVSKSRFYSFQPRGPEPLRFE